MDGRAPAYQLGWSPLTPFLRIYIRKPNYTIIILLFSFTFFPLFLFVYLYITSKEGVGERRERKEIMRHAFA